MEIKKREVQHVGRKKIIKDESEQDCYFVSRAEGDVYEEGTEITPELLEKINFQDDDKIEFLNISNGSWPVQEAGKTKIAAKANGDVYVIPALGKGTEFKLGAGSQAGSGSQPGSGTGITTMPNDVLTWLEDKQEGMYVAFGEYKTNQPPEGNYYNYLGIKSYNGFLQHIIAINAFSGEMSVRSLAQGDWSGWKKIGGGFTLAVESGMLYNNNGNLETKKNIVVQNDNVIFTADNGKSKLTLEKNNLELANANGGVISLKESGVKLGCGTNKAEITKNQFLYNGSQIATEYYVDTAIQSSILDTRVGGSVLVSNVYADYIEFTASEYNAVSVLFVSFEKEFMFNETFLLEDGGYFIKKQVYSISDTELTPIWVDIYVHRSFGVYQIFGECEGNYIPIISYVLF